MKHSITWPFLSKVPNTIAFLLSKITTIDLWGSYNLCNVDFCYIYFLSLTDSEVQLHIVFIVAFSILNSLYTAF